MVNAAPEVCLALMEKLASEYFDFERGFFCQIQSIMAEFWTHLFDSNLENATIITIVSCVDDYLSRHYISKNSRNLSKYYGEKWLTQLLEQNHTARVQDILRMDSETFWKLKNWLELNSNLRDSRYITAAQKLAIFLVITGQGLSQRATMEFFQHSLATISRCFNEVLAALIYLHNKYVQLPIATDTTPTRVLESTKYYPYFKDCLGALDGTHIDAYVSGQSSAPFRDRRGKLSQNVLAVCTFDLKFTYVLAGWEGSAHDARVLKDAVSHHGFQLPAGKYVLGDAGYSNTEFTLVPFRGTRYHLKEQRLAQERPQTAKELFNLRHSSLRNAVERIFGILKRRFKILRGVPEYPFQSQVNLVYALTAVHNFIRIEAGIEALETGLNAEETNEIPECVFIAMDREIISTAMEELRTEMAENMWIDYQRNTTQ